MRSPVLFIDINRFILSIWIERSILIAWQKNYFQFGTRLELFVGMRVLHACGVSTNYSKIFDFSKFVLTLVSEKCSFLRRLNEALHDVTRQYNVLILRLSHSILKLRYTKRTVKQLNWDFRIITFLRELFGIPRYIQVWKGFCHYRRT